MAFAFCGFIFLFYSFLLGNLGRNKQPTKRIIIIKKRKKQLGLGFYSDPSIDFAVCFFAYMLYAAAVLLLLCVAVGGRAPCCRMTRRRKKKKFIPGRLTSNFEDCKNVVVVRQS